MPHAQARVAMALHVVLRPAQPADQKQPEAVPRLAADAALLIRAMHGAERRLVLLHRVIEGLDEREHLVAAADHLVGRIEHRDPPGV